MNYADFFKNIELLPPLQRLLTIRKDKPHPFKRGIVGEVKTIKNGLNKEKFNPFSIVIRQ